MQIKLDGLRNMHNLFYHLFILLNYTTIIYIMPQSRASCCHSSIQACLRRFARLASMSESSSRVEAGSLKPCGFSISTPGKLTFSRPLSSAPLARSKYFLLLQCLDSGHFITTQVFQHGAAAS